MNIAAIIPLRKGSQRVKRKNLRDFHGKPLFQVILDTLRMVDQISKIIVDTNDEEIIEILRDQYTDIKIINRPLELSSEFESVNNIIAHDLDFIEEEIIIQTHATNPLLTANSISVALQQFKDNLNENYDALFSVTRAFERFWDSNIEPVNHDPQKLERTQDLPPFYVENSCFYIFTREGFMKSGNNRLGTKRKIFELSSEEATDIDYPIDFQIALMLAEDRTI